MELASIAAIGVLVGTGVYMLMQKSLLRVVLGTGLLSHGVNIFLLTSGRLKRGGAPLLTSPPAADEHGVHAASGAHAGGEEAAASVTTAPADAVGTVTDPLPQALILTAIVIGFATTALILVIAYRTFQVRGTDDLDRLRGVDGE